MSRIHFPYFNTGWGSMFILQSLTEFLIGDTFTEGQRHSREYVMNLIGNNKVSFLFTHAHHDHTKDYPYYAKKGIVKTLYVSYVTPHQERSKDRDRWNEYIKLTKQYGGKVVFLHTGDVIKIGAATVKVLLAPDLGWNNADSLCLKITAGGVSGLILGDAAQATLKKLKAVAADELKDIVWCKTNHHSGQPEDEKNNPAWWYELIRPTVAISDCCGDDKYVFKSSWGKAVYKILEQNSINIYSTQHNGDLVFEMRAELFRPISVPWNSETIIKNGRQVLVNKSAKHYWVGNFLKEDKTDKELAAEVLLRIHGNGDTRRKRLGTRFDAAQAQVAALVSDREDLLWTIAGLVLKGYLGTGDKRKSLLNVDVGEMYYDDVQDKVKLAIKGADEVLANKYGRNPDRVEKLRAAGYDPVVVQDYINLLLT